MKTLKKKKNMLEVYVDAYIQANSRLDDLMIRHKEISALLLSERENVDTARAKIHRKLVDKGIPVGESVHTSKALLRLNKGAFSVKVVDEKRIPSSYLRIPAPQVNKVAILADFKANGSVPQGVIIEEGEPILVIQL